MYGGAGGYGYNDDDDDDDDDDRQNDEEDEEDEDEDGKAPNMLAFMLGNVNEAGSLEEEYMDEVRYPDLLLTSR